MTQPVARRGLGLVEGDGLGARDVAVGRAAASAARRARTVSVASSEPGAAVDDGVDLGHAVCLLDRARAGDAVDVLGGGVDGAAGRRSSR